MSTSAYQPGVCNIGGPEVERRKQVAKMGALLFTLFSIYIVAKGYPASTALLTFIPAVISAVGFIQSRKKFCFAFGLLGAFNFAELGKLSKVATKEELSADRRQALSIIFQSIGLALLPTALIYFILSL